MSDCVALWTVAHQAPLSMGFSRQEYWSGLPYLLPGDLPDPGISYNSYINRRVPYHQLHLGSPTNQNECQKKKRRRRRRRNCLLVIADAKEKKKKCWDFNSRDCTPKCNVSGFLSRQAFDPRPPDFFFDEIALFSAQCFSCSNFTTDTLYMIYLQSCFSAGKGSLPV